MNLFGVQVTAPKELATEDALALLLRAGVALSSAFLFSGTLWMAMATPVNALSTGGLTYLLSAPHHAQGEALIALGILLLVALPIARVVLSLVLFRLRGDRLYVFLTSAVLTLLLAGLCLGVAMH